MLALCFIVCFVVRHAAAACRGRPRSCSASSPRSSLVYLLGFYNLDTAAGLAQFEKGFVKFLIHFVFLALGVAWLWRRGIAYYWRALAWFFGGIACNAAYGVLQLVAAQAGVNLDSLFISPLTGGASQINIYGAVNGSSVYRPNALTGDPNHLGIMLIVPLLVLTPLYLRLEPEHRLQAEARGADRRSCSWSRSRRSRAAACSASRVGALILALPYRGYLRSRALIAPLAGALAVIAVVVVTRLALLRRRVPVARPDRRRARSRRTSRSTSFIPQILHSHPLLGLGLNNFSIYYQVVTGQDELGPALVLRLADRRDRDRRDGALRRLPALGVRAAARRAARSARARDARGDPLARARPPARVGLDGRARRDDGRERLLPDDVVLLLLRLPGARAGGAARLRRARTPRRVRGAGPRPRSAAAVAPAAVRARLSAPCASAS